MSLRPVEFENKEHIHDIERMAVQYKSIEQYNRDTHTVWIVLAFGAGIIALLLLLIIIVIF